MGTHDPVVEALARLGGARPTEDLRMLTSRRAVRAAVAEGAILRVRRGMVRLPMLDEATAAAHDLRGARSHLSAALHHGWEVAAPPSAPMITIPRTAHASARRARIFWSTLSAQELADGVTDPVRTVVDCARTMPFGDALAVADSALRSRRVRTNELIAAAEASPRTGRSKALRVARAADGRAANPFESLLRGIALGVPGLSVVPQVHIGGAEFIGAADLVDVGLGLVIEAESWGYHGDRAAFDRDVRRYTAMVRAGWRVVRFLWHDVRHRPAHVGAVLADLVAVSR